LSHPSLREKGIFSLISAFLLSTVTAFASLFLTVFVMIVVTIASAVGTRKQAIIPSKKIYFAAENL
jgi:heme/copper-type cytochrome/quinol oxidase subunit 3